METVEQDADILGEDRFGALPERVPQAQQLATALWDHPLTHPMR